MRDNNVMNTQSVIQRTKEEAGQVIILMAFLIGILLAALGLALDGGGLYFLARDVQNAVDASVLAASYAQCTGGDPVIAAQTAATLNGFDDNETDNWVDVSINADGAVEVAISATKPAFFIQIIRPGDIGVTRTGVGFCSPAVDVSNLGGMNATGDCGCDSAQPLIDFSGSNLDYYGGFTSNGVIGFSNGADYDLIDSPVKVGPGCTSKGGDKVDIWDDPDDDWTNNTDANNDGNPDGMTGTVDGGLAGETTQLDENLTDPLGLDRTDFSVSGEYGQKAITNCTSGQICHWTETTRNGVDVANPSQEIDYEDNNKTLQEGIHYASGDIRITNDDLVDTDNDGKLEFTFVSPGQVSFNFMGTPGGKQLAYYPGTDGILVFSSRESNPPCAQSSGDTGIDINAPVNVHGILYAPKSVVGFSVSTTNYFLGAIIGERITGSMSNGYFIYDPSLIPPKPPEVGIEQ